MKSSHRSVASALLLYLYLSGDHLTASTGKTLVPVWRCAGLPVFGWSVWRAAAGLQIPEEGSCAWWGEWAPAGTYDHLHHPPPGYCSPYCTHTENIWLLGGTKNKNTDSDIGTCEHLYMESHTQHQTWLLLALQCAAGWWWLRRDKHIEINNQKGWICRRRHNLLTENT